DGGDRREVTFADLVDHFRSFEIFQTVGAEAPKGYGRLGEQIRRCLRADDLAAVRNRLDPGAAVDGGPEIVAVAQFGLTCVEAGSDAQLDLFGPGFRNERAL